MKEKILTHSADLFLNLGVKSVTMDEIAADLGISKKTIYAHFSTKTKLIEATAIFVFEKISEGIQVIREENHNPIRELFLIKNFAMMHLKNEKSSPQHQLQKYYPKIFATLKKKQQELMANQILNNLERGIDAGLYRRELPLDFTTRIYFVGMIGIKDRGIFPEEKYSMNELIEKHLEYHLRAVVTGQGQQLLDEILNTNSEK